MSDFPRYVYASKPSDLPDGAHKEGDQVYVRYDAIEDLMRHTLHAFYEKMCDVSFWEGPTRWEEIGTFTIPAEDDE